MARARMAIGLDTSCLVPLFCEWHEFHLATLKTFSARPGRRWVISAHVLAECFAVLTRLPPPFRIAPPQARELLAVNFSESADIAEVSKQDVWAALKHAADRGFGGGRVYDAIIAHSTARCGATVMLTWNIKDYLVVAPAGLEVRTP